MSLSVRYQLIYAAKHIAPCLFQYVLYCDLWVFATKQITSCIYKHCLALAISMYYMTFALPVLMAPYLFTGGPSPGNISPSYVKTANSTTPFKMFPIWF